MRLIDADALIDFLDVGHLRHPSELCFSEVDVANLLLHAPTISPDEVRGVGEWLPHPNPQFIEVDVCSVCGLGTRKMYHCTDGVQTWDEKTFFRYCPWCGAKLSEPPKGVE